MLTGGILGKEKVRFVGITQKRREGMKQKKQLQQEALIRREKNLSDYKSGNMGSLMAGGVDEVEFLAKKIKKAEIEILTLKAKISGTLVKN